MKWSRTSQGRTAQLVDVALISTHEPAELASRHPLLSGDRADARVPPKGGALHASTATKVP